MPAGRCEVVERPGVQTVPQQPEFQRHRCLRKAWASSGLGKQRRAPRCCLAPKWARCRPILTLEIQRLQKGSKKASV